MYNAAEEFNTGYKDRSLSWGGTTAVWGNRSIVMSDGGPDAAPGNVKEVRLLKPVSREFDWLDGALITLGPATSTLVQQFNGPRKFIEQPVEGNGIWLGITATEASVMYIPDTVYSVETHKQGGSLEYERHWVQCWINMGKTDFQYIELCTPPYEEDGTIEVLQPDAPVRAPLFWGLWRLLIEEAHAS